MQYLGGVIIDIDFFFGESPPMSNSISSFDFAHIPLNVDRSSINVFQHSEETFTFEYAFFNPKTVHIYMYPNKPGWFQKKGVQASIAMIQQFASSLGFIKMFLGLI